jgi:hypothetical protein
MSDWTYFVPYQEDIEKALHELQYEVLQRGEYHTKYSVKKVMDALEEILRLPSVGERVERIHSRLDHFRFLSLPDYRRPELDDQIADIRWVNEGDSSDSILDIRTIASKPYVSIAAPFTDKELIKLFNTVRPTQAMAEDKIHEILMMRYECQGSYTIIYKNNKPDEILFAGGYGGISGEYW